MRVLVVSAYSSELASMRLRAVPVMRGLASAGHETKSWTVLKDSEVRSWLKGGAGRLFPLARAVAAMPSLLRELTWADVVIVHREALPLNGLFVERAAKRRKCQIIWDLDDALWMSEEPPKQWLRGTASKYRWLSRNAQMVWAGNQNVANWVLRSGASEVRIVPTTVEIPTVTDESRRDDAVLLWIGMPSTAFFLQDLLNRIGPRLRNWKLLVVGGSVTSPENLPTTCLPWSQLNEREALEKAWIGLYPLDAYHPMMPGKSALKSILYQGFRVPCIATPTDATQDRGNHMNGCMFARTDDEWLDAIETLRDPDVREEQSRLAADMARQFSTTERLPVLLDDAERVYENAATRNERRAVGLVRSPESLLVLAWGIDQGLGGSERRLLEVIPELRALGVGVHSIHVHSGDGSLMMAMREAGADVSHARSLFGIPSAVDRLNPDVVWSFGDRVTAVLGGARRLGLVRRTSKFWMAQNVTWNRALPASKLVKFIATPELDLCVANSREAARFASTALQLDSDRIKVLVPSVDKQWSYSPAPRRDGRRRRNFIMVGNNSPRKQLNLGVHLIKALPDDCMMTIYTDEGDELRRLGESLGLREGKLRIFTGHEMIAQDYDEADVLVHTSYAESVPRVILEAASRGCVTVGFSVAGVKNYANIAIELGDWPSLVEWCEALVVGEESVPHPKLRASDSASYARSVVSLL